jgi:hypothetical protein
VTDSIDELHAQAGLGLLVANPALGGTRVFDSVVPNATPDINVGWVLVYTHVAWPRDGVGTGLDAAQDTVTTTYTCHCVGATPVAARVVAMQVRSTLLGVRPTIANRLCGLIKQAVANPPIRDESLGFAVFDEVMEFDFTSTG